MPTPAFFLNDPATRTARLAEARANVAAAQERERTAKTKAARRDAAEEVDFWQGKAAFYAHATA